MKKVIPVLIAIVLIIVIVGVAFGNKIYEKYSYSQERADKNEYFQIIKEGQVPIILQDERAPYDAQMINGTVYFDVNTIKELLNDRFYYDFNENLVLYTTPDTIISAPLDGMSYFVGTEEKTEEYVIATTIGDTLYIAADYIKKYTNFEYTLFQDPNYIQLYTEWNSVPVATLTKDTALRVRGGVKSPILEDLPNNATVVILEEMDTWTKVKSPNSLIGYVENRYLSNQTTQERTPVTEYVEPEYTSISLDKPICLGWHAIGGPGGNTTISDVLAQATPINVISPTWFHLTDNEGNFTSYATQSYVDYAHAKGIQVWALISGLEFGESNGLDPQELLSYTSKRKVLIDNIIAEIQKYSIDGINIDFENITQESSDHFIEFIRELSIKCRANGIILSIDNYVPKAYNLFYDRKEQGIVADYVIIMGYDEHIKTGGEVGSVASFEFTSDGIVETLKDVPAQKVINAVPFYTVRWESVGDSVSGGNIDMAEAKDFVKRNGLSEEWDDVICQNYAELYTDSTFYQIWLEDEDSMDVRLNLVKIYNLAGIAVWRLGYEEPSIWDLFKQYGY